MSEELKPCPYHGDPAAMELSTPSNKFAACRKCDRLNSTWYRPIEEWNNAFAWKEIDKWKSLAGELLNLNIGIGTWAKANGHTEIERLCEGMLAKAREEGAVSQTDLFMRLYARMICCPCLNQSCAQCKLDIGALRESGLIDEAAKIAPVILELKEKK